MGNNIQQQSLDIDQQLLLQQQQSMVITKEQEQFYEKLTLGFIVSRQSLQRSVFKGVAVMISPNLLITAAQSLIEAPQEPYFIHALFNSSTKPSCTLTFHPIIRGEQAIIQKGYQIECVRYSSQLTYTSDNQKLNHFAIGKLSNRIDRPIEAFLPLSALCNVCLSKRYRTKNIRIYGPTLYSVTKIKNNSIKEALRINNYIMSKYYYLNEIENVLFIQKGDFQPIGCPIFFNNHFIGINNTINSEQARSICKIFNQQTIDSMLRQANQIKGQVFKVKNRVCYHAETTEKQKLSQLQFQRGQTYYKEKDYRNAIKSFSMTIQLNPNNFKAYKKRGLSHKQLKEYENSINDFDKTIVINPNQFSVYLTKGQILQELKDYQNAIINFSQAIQIDPTSCNAYQKRGDVYQIIKNYQTAILDYDKAIKIAPNKSINYNNKGITLIQLNDYTKALQCFDKAIQIYSRDEVYYINRAFCYKKLNNHQSEIKDYDKALRINPESSDALFYKGQAYQYVKDYVKAIQYFDKAITIKPKCQKSHYLKGYCLQLLKDYKNAIISFDNTLKINAHHFAHFNKGASLYYLKDYQNALLCFDEVIKHHPLVECYFKKGLTLYCLKEYQKSLEYLDRAIQMDNKIASYYYLKSLVYKMLNNQQKHVQNYGRAMQMNPKVSDSFPELNTIQNNDSISQNKDNHVGIQADFNSLQSCSKNNAYIYLSDFQQSAFNLDKAMQLNTTNQYLRNRGKFSYLLKDYESAVRDYDKVIEESPNDYFTHYERGLALKALNRYSQALKDFQLSLSIHPNNPLYQMKIIQCLYQLNDEQRFLQNWSKYREYFGCSENIEQIRAKYNLTEEYISRIIQDRQKYDLHVENLKNK